MPLACTFRLSRRVPRSYASLRRHHLSTRTPTSCQLFLTVNHHLKTTAPASIFGPLQNGPNLHTTSCRAHNTQSVMRPYVDPKVSFAYGRSGDHLVHSSLAREFIRKTKEKPDETVYISHFEKKQVTFKEFSQDVNRLAKSMVKKFGIERGDSVGIYAYNCYLWLVVQFACARIGAVLTPINPSNKAQELAYVLQRANVKCLFLPGSKSVQTELNSNLELLQADNIVELSRSGDLTLKNAVLMDPEHEYSKDELDAFKLPSCKLHNWSSTESDGLIFETHMQAEEAGLDENEALVVNPELFSPDDIYAIYFTSGTTGAPKGACVSNFTALNNVKICQGRMRHGRNKDWRATVSSPLPMFHIFAGVLNTMSPFVGNTCTVIPSFKYDIPAFVESIIENDANLVTLTPTILIDLLSYVEAKGIKDLPLDMVQSGGASLLPEVVSRAFKVLPGLKEVRTGYGSSENGAVATMQNLLELDELKPLTVGPPIDFTEVRIVKPGTDVVLPHGQHGEIQTRGFNTMVEYLGEPEKTAEVLTRNRWYRTGDLGFMYPHGSLQIVGRLKHMIIKGGENIYPEEVEQMIMHLDYIEDVHVVGVPDQRFGEQVCAWIKLKPGYRAVDSVAEKSSDKDVHLDDIRDFCNKNITYFKIPKYMLFVDSFPMTPTKKVQYHVITQRSCEIFNLQT